MSAGAVEDVVTPFTIEINTIQQDRIRCRTNVLKIICYLVVGYRRAPFVKLLNRFRITEIQISYSREIFGCYNIIEFIIKFDVISTVHPDGVADIERRCIIGNG